MRILLAQVGCVLGDVDANLDAAVKVIAEAAAQDADLVVFPELFLHGYALGHIGQDRSIRAGDARLAALSTTTGPDLLIGYHEDGGTRTYNAASYLSAGRTVHLHRKLYLPNYLAWEERKHVSPGQSMRGYDTRFGRMATLLCNDAWQPVLPWLAVQDGAEVLLIATNSASPPDPRNAPVPLDTVAYWQQLLSFTARMQQCWVIFVNRVGIETNAHFWGGSQVVDPSGDVVRVAPKWEESLITVDVDVSAARRRQRSMPLVGEARLSLIGREVKRLIREGGDA